MTADTRDKYHRPVTKRFDPAPIDKQAMCTSWMNADRVSRAEIESNYSAAFMYQFYADDNGYHTA